MDTEQQVIAANKAASTSEIKSSDRTIYLCSSTGESRMNTDKHLAAQADEILYCWKKYGRYTNPLIKKRR